MKILLTTTLAAAMLAVAPAAQAQWTQLIPQGPQDHYQLSDITFTPAGTGYATGYSWNNTQGVVLRSTDAGATWQAIQTMEYSYDLSFANSTDGFLISRNGDVQKTTDGGTTWQTAGSVGGNVGSMHFHTPLHGVVVGWYPGFISTTTDGAQTWQTSHFGFNLHNLHFPTPQVGYAVGDGMFRTTNGGTSWDTISVFGYRGGVFFTSPSTGIWATSTYWIGRTANGGDTWNSWQSSSSGISYLNDTYFPDPLNGYAVGQNGTILKTTDGGISWTESPSGTTQHLNSVFCPDANTCYIAGDSSTLLKTTTGGVLASNGQVKPIKELQLFPNPATGSFTLQLEPDLAGKGAVLQLLDITGKLSMEKPLSAGVATVEVSVTQLLAGVYTAKVIADKNVFVGKLVVQ